MSEYKLGIWAVTDGNMATAGKVVSVHRSLKAAKRMADKIGGCYETAQIMAMVQVGFSYTEAVQAMAGKPIDEAYVRIGV